MVREEENMQYGHFDNEKREYVIDRIDVPVSWTNYIGTGDMMGAPIINAQHFATNALEVASLVVVNRAAICPTSIDTRRQNVP